jgi:hypothetical protein
MPSAVVGASEQSAAPKKKTCKARVKAMWKLLFESCLKSV